MPNWKPPVSKPTAPAAPAKPVARVPDMPAKEQGKPAKETLELAEARSSKGVQPAKGFDPYNSGAFNVRDTWSKVIRK